MDVTVIICTYNRCQGLKTVLECMEAQSLPGRVAWEVLIVNNNSTDETRNVVQTFIDRNRVRFRYLLEPQPGKSFALNAGIRSARGDILAFTDDDVTIDSRWLEGIVDAFRQLDCIGVGGRIVPVWSCRRPAWLQLEGPHKLHAALVYFDQGEEICRLHTPPFGANMAFRKEAFTKYGFFRTDLGPRAGTVLRGEDTEFCKSVLDGGDTLMYLPQAVVHHPVDRERLRKSYFRSWYFNYGKALVRRGAIPGNTKRYFGVPRFLYRSLIGSFLAWAVALNRQRRFYHELNTYEIAGQIAESRSLARSRSGATRG